ncbi:MAG: DUF58 domain-containing protein [Candidatus Eremiobacteraeota bacterium]|nr:DUF58 domain-containing protein [Candidatus Eremiobacteraeota bacterium]
MNDLRTALLRGRNRPRSAGSGSPTTFRGDGYEFVELREYVTGDDPRRIDWASTARTGTLQTRVVLEDVALTLAAVVDASASMRVGRKRSLADAALDALHAWYDAALADDRCARVTDDGLVAPLGLRGRRSAHACAAASPSASNDFAGALTIAYAALPRGTALLAIGDFFDTGPEHHALFAQLGSRFDCTALVARDPWFDDFPLAGFVRVRDVESGAARRLFIGKRERERYREATAERERALRETLRASNWRTGVLREEDGAHCLYEAFALR